jgi:hypothetical protein
MRCGTLIVSSTTSLQRQNAVGCLFLDEGSATDDELINPWKYQTALLASGEGTSFGLYLFLAE